MASVSWPSAVVAPDGTTIGFNSAGLLTVLQAPKLVLPSGLSIQQDSSNHMGFFNGSTEFEILDGVGHHVFVNTSGSTNNYNIEVITNGTTTTLTSPANSISNYPYVGDIGVLYIRGNNLFIDGENSAVSILSNQTNGNRLLVPGNIGIGAFGGAGNYLIYNLGAVAADSAFSAVNLSASYSTTSTTPVSTGLGTAGVIVSRFIVGYPLVVNFEGYGYNNTLGDGVTLSLYVSTAGVPAQGSAPPSTDTLLTSITVTQEGSASNPNSMPITYVYKTTSQGTYYFYVAINAVTGGTATIATPSTIVVRGW